MANKRKQPKIDPRDIKFPTRRMSDMSQEELEELFRSEGLPPPVPLEESRI